MLECRPGQNLGLVGHSRCSRGMTFNCCSIHLLPASWRYKVNVLIRNAFVSKVLWKPHPFPPPCLRCFLCQKYVGPPSLPEKQPLLPGPPQMASLLQIILSCLLSLLMSPYIIWIIIAANSPKSLSINWATYTLKDRKYIFIQGVLTLWGPIIITSFHRWGNWGNKQLRACQAHMASKWLSQWANPFSSAHGCYLSTASQVPSWILHWFLSI